MYEDDDEKPTPQKDADDFEADKYDEWVESMVQLPKDDQYHLGTVLRRKRNNDGLLIGRSHHDPVEDTSVYECSS